MQIGSQAHKELFCRSFVATHVAYEPENLPWPALEPSFLMLLQALPIWGTALQIERNAGAMVSTLAEDVSDAEIRAAVALQGFEEQRHARLIEVMIARYQLPADSLPPAAEATEDAFIDFGAGECVDSFLGFGFFALARELGLAPDALLTIFDRVLAEEARHIVFFVNWTAYERAHRSRAGRLRSALANARGYTRGLLNVAVKAAAIARKPRPKQDAELRLALAELTLPHFLDVCLAENERRMAAFDRRLLRPQFMPALASVAVTAAKAAHVIDRLATKQLAPQ